MKHPKLISSCLLLTLAFLTHCSDQEKDKKPRNLKVHEDPNPSSPEPDSSDPSTSDDANKPRDAGENDPNAALSGDDASIPDGSNFAEATSSELDEVNFEKLSLDEAVKANLLNLTFDMPGTRQEKTIGNRLSDFRETVTAVPHNWKLQVPYLGHSRGSAMTYLNGEKVDAVTLYVDKRASTSERKVYRYQTSGSLTNAGGLGYDLDVRIVHDRVEGKCYADLYRHNSLNTYDTNLDRKAYTNVEADCPIIDRSLADELAFVQDNKWELTGQAFYDGYLSDDFEDVTVRVESYELFHPWIRIYVGAEQHAYVTFTLDIKNSTDSARHYKFSYNGASGTFIKNLDSNECTFTYQDEYFTSGMNIRGDCSTK